MSAELDIGPGRVDIRRARRRSEWRLQCLLTINDVAVNLTGATVTAELRERADDASDLVVALSVDLTDAASGVVVLSLSAVASGLLDPGVYWWECVIDDVAALPDGFAWGGRWQVVDAIAAAV